MNGPKVVTPPIATHLPGECRLWVKSGDADHSTGASGVTPIPDALKQEPALQLRAYRGPVPNPQAHVCTPVPYLNYANAINYHEGSHVFVATLRTVRTCDVITRVRGCSHRSSRHVTLCALEMSDQCARIVVLPPPSRRVPREVLVELH